MTSPTIGVFALQGDVREHLAVLGGLGVRAVGVRRPEELDAVDGLVLPGGDMKIKETDWLVLTNASPLKIEEFEE